jgi:hypothetical protein
MRAVLVVFTLLAACGGGTPAKMDAAIDAFFSTCGHPGDTGNEKGIGKFCQALSDCQGTMAPLCSILGDTTTHFCTTTCQMMGSDASCGTNATCECNASNQCGCTPNACLGM